MISVTTVLNTAFQIFSVVTQKRFHLRHHNFQKSQKYLYNGKNIKKISFNWPGCSLKVAEHSI